MQWLNLDPNLPTLQIAMDSAAVAQRFEQQWPTATADVKVKECRRQDVQYTPGQSCVATYSLLVEKNGAAEQTIGVVEASPSGVKHRLFAEDPQLPALALAANSAALRKHVTAQHRQYGSMNVDQLGTAIPVRYKPGSRCTFRYDLHTATGRQSCFGKLLTRNSAQLWQTAATLHKAGQHHTELPRISQPLAFWPEMEMLVQAAVAGEELHTIAFDAQLDPALRLDWVRTAGRCTAALHTLAGQEYRNVAKGEHTLAGDLADLDEYRPALRQLNPALAERFDETTARLNTAIQAKAELPAVLSHGALRTDQFMIESYTGKTGRMVLIDLDSICWSNPARDLGNFLGYLTWKALRQPQHAAFIQNAQQAFLAGYRTLNSLPDADWIACYQAASLLKIIGRRYTGLTYKEWAQTEDLLNIAQRMIE